MTGTDLSNINLDAFKGQAPSTAFAGAKDAGSLADGIGSSYGVIGYRGKVWSLRYRGETHVFNRKDDGSPINYIDVVFLRDPGVKSKSYYAEGFNEGSSSGKRPTCASLNGIVPDADVQQKQSDTCALCPQNVWKKDVSGRNVRGCSDYKQLAVLVLPQQTQDAMGVALNEPVFLRIPPASLNDLARVGEAMEKQGWHYFTFVTRISFAPNVAYPQFVFKPHQKLTDQEAEIVLQLREDPLAKRITGEEKTDGGLLKSVPLTVGASPSPAAPQAALAQQPVTQPPPNAPPSAVAPSSPPAAQTPVRTATVLEMTPDAGGAFGLTPPTVTAPVTPQPAAVAPADTSSFEGADPAFDAKLDALLNTK